MSTSARSRLVHVCTACGATHPQWAGRCSSCGAWNTLEVAARPAARPVAPLSTRPGPTRLGEVDLAVGRPEPTGVPELDRVLGGGLVPGSVTLLGGEPGVGKSTLLLQLVAGRAGPSVYVSAEESVRQVRLRAERLGVDAANVWLHGEIALPRILDELPGIRPRLVVVDSIQTVVDPELGSPAGGVTQVRACAQRLVEHAKEHDVAVVVVGHVTKDGGLAGPRVLEHVVDTVLHFEGDRHHALRMLRAVKHRFGPTSELGLFEMTAGGLVGVPDPSHLFLADRCPGVAGSAVVPTVDGHRPLVVEVQALAAPSVPGVPARRTAQGLDGGRLSMLMAVLDRRVGLPAGAHDVYASAAGGVRLTEPGVDLAVCLAVAGAVVDVPLPPDLVAFGEVGLGGEVRHAAQAERRLGEASRLGFRRAIVPTGTSAPDAGPEALPAATVAEALALAGLELGAPGGRARRDDGPTSLAGRRAG